ncbi:UDP-N-acetylmuramoylalanyl-D-glutamate--2,6-diaminopimelate ligase [Atopomonas hussainii]|uniref:UDP-N-acetylmuramoyl-L-alanyl-D-glutamate--2,6-diaminopimelate ligase n=1 Tax=Atopomonas hussainii TaxID=1429083 RepID=A0A1H7LLZ6_9GAMM|nr:UDP-N-acetylmuramoyl-L-alanyl-D-glutamate--2,6-diaminopimelate ligase [Atopomonas hussainii]SEK99983.1 UDP-N-acetylmuramoylalanyl-D-glutamate--2,6-diaminopimelate ligase [Atopomonas hussainii]
MPMPLNQLLVEASSSTLIRELTLDSRKVRAGDLFLALPGVNSDGRSHIADALARGAAAVAYESEGAGELPQTEVPLVPVKHLAQHLSAIAGRFYGEPSRNLAVVGVTGTNGKTSVSQLLAQVLGRLETPCAIIGTLGNGFFDDLKAGVHTTPDALSVQAELARFKQAGAQAVSMEVSSHGLEQGRVAALHFDVAVLTNLSRDHLDYHGSMQAYAAAKAKLFQRPELRARVLNLDDAFGVELAEQGGEGRLLSYSVDNPQADLYCTAVSFSDDGIEARLAGRYGEAMLRSPLLGRFNLSNLLAVIGALLALDYPLADVLRELRSVQGPQGRMQRLGGGDKPLVVVDYAHTPDALEKVLEALRPHCHGRLLCLFGCGGDRDRGKRPLMAQIAERLADQVIVTDDNPRTEAPEQIFADIQQGFSDAGGVQVIAGRAAAIAQTIAAAKAADVVLLAGKGHEPYQEINGVRHAFSDLEQAQAALEGWEAADA